MALFKTLGYKKGTALPYKKALKSFIKLVKGRVDDKTAEKKFLKFWTRVDSNNDRKLDSKEINAFINKK